MAGGGTVRAKYAVYIFKIFRNEHTGSVYAQLFSLEICQDKNLGLVWMLVVKI